MTQDTGSFKKVAVLTGLTMLVGGAEIASAATTLPETHFFALHGLNPPTSLSTNLSYNLFNSSLGTLTDVAIGLSSSIFENSGVNFTASAGSSLSGLLTGSPLIGTGNGSWVPFVSTTHPPLAGYTGVGNFTVGLIYSVACGEAVSCGEGWQGNVSVTYTYNPAAVPLPAALPLFATGVAGLGLMGWLKRFRQKAKKQA